MSFTCVIVHPDAVALSALTEEAGVCGLQVKGAVRDAQAFLACLPSLRPHVVFLHALTPGFDPADMERKMVRLPLMRRPAFIYLVPDALPPRQKNLLLPALPARPSGEEMCAAAAVALPLPVSLALFRRAETLVTRMGLPDHPARSYIAFAVGMAYNDFSLLTPLTGTILPALAHRYGTSPRRAADAMRRLIDRAWTTGDIEAQYAFFGNTIEEARGKPTLTAFIATAAEYLRLGGDL